MASSTEWPVPRTRTCLPRRRAQRTSSRISSSDRKSTRLNSSHSQISYAVFCLKKKTQDSLPPVRVLAAVLDQTARIVILRLVYLSYACSLILLVDSAWFCVAVVRATRVVRRVP